MWSDPSGTSGRRFDRNFWQPTKSTLKIFSLKITPNMAREGARLVRAEHPKNLLVGRNRKEPNTTKRSQVYKKLVNLHLQVYSLRTPLRPSKNGHENGHEIYFLHCSITPPSRPSPTKPGTSNHSQLALVDYPSAHLPIIGHFSAMAPAKVSWCASLFQ